MFARCRGMALAILAVFVLRSAAHADDVGYAAGRGGVGGQFGAADVLGAGDYSKGDQARFGFSGHWRYAITKSLRWQLSPGFTWAAYKEREPAPFRDLNNPADSTKKEYLTLLLPISLQLQLTRRTGPWLYYLGAGPGAYRVWVENRRKVLKDPASKKLHRGMYPGATAQLGVERFFKSLSTTSVELSLDAHYVLAKRDEQFPSGWNDKLLDSGLRIGVNYYFAPNTVRKKDLSPPGIPSP